MAWYTKGQAVSPQDDGTGPEEGEAIRELAGAQEPETCVLIHELQRTVQSTDFPVCLKGPFTTGQRDGGKPEVAGPVGGYQIA